MQTIKELSPIEAQKIAAGEVVERPANVVKELIENAIDAKATKISIYIEHGGQTLIRIVDNGIGMSRQDVHACIKHHATSKITSVDDLTSIQSFGFRGEALSSINAVSRLTIRSKQANADLGIEVIREQETIHKEHEVAAPQGTDLAIADLFYNVPARKKFLKKTETEWRAIVQLFQAFCLDYLSIHFQLYTGETLAHNCPPTTKAIQRMAQLFGGNIAQSLMELPKTTKNNVTISGVISNAHLYRYNRNQCFFLVNNRWVKNYQLGKAVMKGYHNILPPNKYPLAVIYIELDPSLVDINIHPRKEEVQFLHPRQVDTLLFETVKKRLEAYVSEQLATTQQPIARAAQPLPAASEAAIEHPQPSPPKAFQTTNSLPPMPINMPSTDTSGQPFEPFSTTPAAIQELTVPQAQPQQPLTEQKPVTRENNYTILGVAHKTYIMLEHADGIYFVDQHAAHECILYELFEKRFKELDTIALLFPEVIELTKEDVATIEQYTELFEDHGIKLELFGEQQLRIASTPVHLKGIAWKPFILEQLEAIRTYEQEGAETVSYLHKKLRAMMACKAAIKAGDTLSKPEIIQLLHDLDKTTHKTTCPHGRPTGWLLPLYDIKKKFKRVV